MTIDEYENLLELSDLEIYAYLKFDLKIPDFIIQYYDYNFKLLYEALRVPEYLLLAV